MAAELQTFPLFSLEALIALATLTLLEIVLGIDNIVFVTILVAKLPEAQWAKARRIGLGLAMLMRIALLVAIAWVARLTTPLVELPKSWSPAGGTFGVSGRDLILLFGGLFLIAKATYEIHDKLEGEADHGTKTARAASFGTVLTQIVLLDIVFSLDSVITAVGMTTVVPIMIAAVVLAVGVMLIFAGTVAGFVERHPTVKMLALSFLILIGVTLVAEGLHAHVAKGYIYFAMAFSLAVEILNIRLRKKTEPLHLRQSYVDSD